MDQVEQSDKPRGFGPSTWMLPEVLICKYVGVFLFLRVPPLSCGSKQNPQNRTQLHLGGPLGRQIKPSPGGKRGFR